ncbi:MAG TPA: YncE family protein [Blastocatellia bacterium]|nr:YncE family protein [Blastocatellia bacterium]
MFIRNRIGLLGRAVALAFIAALTCGTARTQGSTARGHLLVLNKIENTLAIIDPATLKVVGRVITGVGPHELAVSSDGRFAYVANYGTKETVGSTISVIDIAARKEIKRVDLGKLRRPHGIVESGGKVYFTAEASKAVGRYDPQSGRVDWTVETGQNITHMLALTPDRKKIYTANILSDTVTAIDTSAATATHIAVGKQPEGLDVSPDGSEVWVGHNGDGEISIIDTATDKVKQRIKAAEVPIRIKFTPDGKRVLVTDPKAGELIVLDAASRKEIKRIRLGGVPVGVLVTPDGRSAFVAAMQAGKVIAINLDTFSVAGTINPGQGPDGLAWAGK